MKTKNNLNVNFEEISPSESEVINGGVVPPPLAIAGVAAGVLMGICGLAYYAGYQIGKLTA